VSFGPPAQDAAANKLTQAAIPAANIRVNISTDLLCPFGSIPPSYRYATEELMPRAVVCDEENIMPIEEGSVAETTIWKTCSSCKEGIALGAIYWTCSVSTCNRKRTALFFCSVSCWDAHVPMARHRDAWAEEKRAPRNLSAESSLPKKPARTGPVTPTPQPSRRIVRPVHEQRAPESPPRETLIVASRLKDYVRARSGFNTSERTLGPLSEIVRVACDAAIEAARLEGRRTILDRDIPKP